MLVLLVSERDVVVGDVAPMPDGSPPPTLTFQGLDVEGPGGRLQPGPDLVYRLAGRADLDPYGRIARATSIPAENLGPAVRSALDDLVAPPVYLELDPATASAFLAAEAALLAAQEARHPSVSKATPAVPPQRPHLRLAPAPDVDPLEGGDPVCLWCAREGLPSPHAHESDDHPDVASTAPTFSLDGIGAAFAAGGLTEGMVIRLAGLTEEHRNGLYVVGVITDGVSPTEVRSGETVEATRTGDLIPLRADDAAPESVAALRREAMRAREEAIRIRPREPRHADALLEAAAGYERHASRLAAAGPTR